MKSMISIEHMVRPLGCSYRAMTSRSENWMVRSYKIIPLISYDVVRRYENRTNNGGSAELHQILAYDSWKIILSVRSCTTLQKIV